MKKILVMPLATVVLLCSLALAQGGIGGRGGIGGKGGIGGGVTAGGSATIALSQKVYGDSGTSSATCGTSSATTCTVSITTSSGHLLVFSVVTINNVTISSINQGGTLGLCTSSACHYYTPVLPNAIDAAYVLSSSPVSSITVTFSGAHGGAGVEVRDYTCTGGSGTFAYDVGGAGNNSSASSPYTGQALTLNDTNDVIVAMGGSGNDVSSVASPYGNLFVTTLEDNTGGFGIADHLNTSSGAAAVWTDAGASNALYNALAIYCH